MKKPDRDTFILFAKGYVNLNRRINIIHDYLLHFKIDYDDLENPMGQAFLNWIDLYDLSDEVLSCLEDMINNRFVDMRVNDREIRVDTFDNLYDIIYGD